MSIMSNLLGLLKKIIQLITFPFRWFYVVLSEWFSAHILSFLFCGVLFACAMVVVWHRVVVVVPAGFVGVLYRPFFSGVVMDEVLLEGVNILFPLNSATLYDARAQTKKISMEVLTMDQLKSTVTVSFQYQISKNSIPMLHKFVGPDYLNKIILPEVTGKTRIMFAEVTSSEAFTKKLEGVVNEIAINSDQVILEKLSPPGLDNVRLVRISAVQLESMAFPSEIDTAIRNKLVEAQIAEGYVYKLEAERKEAERKVIEAGGIKKFQEIVNSGLTDNYLKMRGIEATLKLAESNNSKIVMFGSSPNGLPLVLGDVNSQETTPTVTPKK
jgi:regulator of protease activity HflC (stomatin/prohibitin superfamily)